MKILLVTNMYPSKSRSYGGLFVKNQYEELLKWKNDTEQIDYFHMPRIITSKFFSILKYVNAFVLFVPFLFKKYHIIHLHYVFPLFIPVMLYKFFHRNVKVIFTWHGSDINNFFDSTFSKWFYHKLCDKKIDLTIAVGDDLKEQIKEKLKQEVNLVMCVGVNHNLFYYDPSIKKKYDFLFVGDFMGRKGIPQLVEAIRKINHGSFTFCFCGLGELEQDIKSLSSKHVSIDLQRDLSQDELRYYYNASRFMIIPSNYEPFGLVASEALFCGTPTIVSPNGGLPSQIEHEKNGFILNEVSPKCIYDMLMKAANIKNSDYAQLAEYAKKSNHEFRLDKVANNTLKIYREILGDFNPKKEKKTRLSSDKPELLNIEGARQSTPRQPYHHETYFSNLQGYFIDNGNGNKHDKTLKKMQPGKWN